MKGNNPTTTQITQLHAWLMSFVCFTLFIFAAAAATRLPHYLATSDYVRLVSVALFNVLVLAGLADNLHTHFSLWQRQNNLTILQTKVAAQD